MIIFNETNVTAENRWGRRCVCVWGSLMDCRPSIFFWIGVLINYIDIIFLDQVLTLESLVLPITSNFHWNWLSMNHWNWQLFDSSIENGYLTGFSEDGVWDGPFQYRLKGFSLPPTGQGPRTKRGSCLSYLGRHEEAVQVLKEACNMVEGKNPLEVN